MKGAPDAKCRVIALVGSQNWAVDSVFVVAGNTFLSPGKGNLNCNGLALRIVNAEGLKPTILGLWSYGSLLLRLARWGDERANQTPEDQR